MYDVGEYRHLRTVVGLAIVLCSMVALHVQRRTIINSAVGAKPGNADAPLAHHDSLVVGVVNRRMLFRSVIVWIAYIAGC